MKPSSWILFFLSLSVYSPCFGAAREGERPDKEMLGLMDFLRDWEMIKEMEMMQELQHIEPVGINASGEAEQKPFPGKKKEGVK